MNKRPQAPASAEYPYQPIYRPWSWILSSSTNLFLFAIVVGMAWMVYKRRKARGRRRVVTYRRVNVNTTLLESEDSTKINALVTGGSGMLGREIVQSLVTDGGYKVHSLDLAIPEEENRNCEVCSYIQTDITNLDDLCIAVKGMDVVFHTAAILPTTIAAKNGDFDEVNLKGTENVIMACKKGKVKRLIYTSSVDVVMGKGAKNRLENADEDYPFPCESLNAYIRTKRSAEIAVLAANGKDNLTTSAIRPGGILELIIRFKLDRPIYMGEKGLFYPAASCEDVAKVHLQLDKVLLNQREVAAGKAFIVSTTISERELAETIARELGDGQVAESFSMALYTVLTYINVACYFLTGTTPIHPLMTVMTLDFMNLPPHTFSSARAQRELGWKQTPWEDTVKKAVKDWKETKKNK